MIRLGNLEKRLIGKKVGRLRVQKFAGRSLFSGRMMTTWLCKCECGNTVVWPTQYLTSGCAISCGCASRKSGMKYQSRLFKRFGMSVKDLAKKHGMSEASIYKWAKKKPDWKGGPPSPI